ncbi:MAG: ABC transporter substrate-binding protein [Deltaproteobacteria bacterium]
MPVFRFRSHIAAFLVVAAGCKPAERAAQPSDTLRDDYGTPIAIGRAPRRIVSLNPATTEILFAIGAGPRLVGRSQYDVFPDSAKLVPSVGAALRPNIEAVLATHPDLVVLYASEDNRPAADRFRQAGIQTVAFKNDSIAQFARDARLLGRVTGDSARAATLVDSVMATLERVRTATAGLPHPTVLIHAWDRPIIVIGGGSFLSELLAIAGARNVYADIHAPSAAVTLEDIVTRNPDYVLASPVAAPKMRASESWNAIPAVRAGKVLVYDTVLVGRPSVSLGAAAVSLANLIHPGAVR